ncbi:MAG TPA: hypothetical protein VK524_31620 [Polyangiaceae bacterium]|nr:hypothetical protein [Polyangiaceae bacterium]
MPGRFRVRLPRPGGAALVLNLLANGCAIGASTRLDTVTELPDEPRHAPGVAVDPVAPLPNAQASGATSERLLVLETPLDPALPKEAARRFFEAVLHEDEAALESLLADDASFQPGPQGSRQSARAVWQARFARLPYQSLFGYAVVREGTFETYAAGEATRILGARNLPISVAARDVLLRAPVVRTHLAKSRMFGDEILFVLTPQARSYKIRTMVEDFTLP